MELFLKRMPVVFHTQPVAGQITKKIEALSKVYKGLHSLFRIVSVKQLNFAGESLPAL